MLSKNFLFFGLVLVALFSISATETIEDNILQLTNLNFEPIVRELPYILIIFYNPLQPNAHQFFDEFVSTAISLKNEEHPLRFAKVDVSIEISLVRRLVIGVYPTIKLVYFGKQKTYEGKIIESEMKSWIKENIRLPKLLSSLSEFEEALEKNNIIVNFWGDTKMNEYVLLNYIAEDHKDLTFVYTNSEEVKEKYKPLDNTLLSIFKKFDEPRVDYKGYFYAEGLKSFLNSNKVPLLIDFDPGYSRRFFYGNIPTIILIYSDNPESKKALQAMNSVKKLFQGRIFLTIKNIKDKWAGELLDIFSDSNADIPLLAMVRPSLQEPLKFVLRDTYITDKVIKQFYQDCLEGQEIPFYKSQPIPKLNNETVKVIVGKTFNQIAYDETKNVFVLFYSNWSQESQSLLEIWKKLGENMKERGDLIFGKIDTDYNECEGFENTEIPSLLLFPKNKSNTIRFYGSKNIEGLLQWLEPKITEIKENNFHEEKEGSNFGQNENNKDETIRYYWNNPQDNLEYEKITSKQKDSLQIQSESEKDNNMRKEIEHTKTQSDISQIVESLGRKVNEGEKETKIKNKAMRQEEALTKINIDL